MGATSLSSRDRAGLQLEELPSHHSAFDVIQRGVSIGLLQLVPAGARPAKLLVDGLARGIGHGTLWIVGFHLIVTEPIDQELLPHVLEEVFLMPAFEHPIGDHDIAQVPPARQYGRLLAVVGEPRYLAQSESALQKPRRLVVEKVFHRTAIQLGRPQDKSLFGNPPHTALAVGQDIKTHRQQLLEEFGTPSSTVEDDRDAPAGTDQIADLFEYG